MLEPHHSQVLPAVLILFASVTSLLMLARNLPAQNVLAVAAIVAMISGVIEGVGAKFGTPFGQFIYGVEDGPKLFRLLPWFVPLIWIVIVINARGVARLI